MKKIITFVILSAISVLILTGCATRTVYLGGECNSENPFKPCVVPPASEDHTHGIAPAMGENIRNQSRNTGTPNTGATNPGNAPTVQDGGNANITKKGAIVNTSSFDILVEITIYYLPGRINANQIVSSAGTYIPGYTPLSVVVSRRSSVPINLKPGDYDVTVYRLMSGQNGKKRIKNDALHVDVTPGQYVVGDQTLAFAYYF